jgi:hypothetical protein
MLVGRPEEREGDLMNSFPKQVRKTRKARYFYSMRILPVVILTCRTETRTTRFASLHLAHSSLASWALSDRRPVDLPRTAFSFAWNVNKIHSIPDGVFSPGILFYK